MSDFLINPKILKIGGFGDFSKNLTGKNGGPPMALGQSIIAKNFAGGFRDIVKTNFPEIPFPPPGGNQFPAKSKKWFPAIFKTLF